MSAVLPSTASGAPSAVPQRGAVAPAPAAAADDDKKPRTVSSAIERLALSRERLRDAMLPAPKTPSSGLAGGIQSMAARVVEKVRTTSTGGIVMDTVETWWEQHPLRTATLVGAEIARKAAAPLAERNPLMLIGGAVLFGAVLAMTRPWRWLLRPALFAGLFPALAATAVKQLPIDTLLRLFSSDRDVAPTPRRAAPPAPRTGTDPLAPTVRMATASTGRPSSAPTSAESVSAIT